MTPNQALIDRLSAEERLWQPSPLSDLLRDAISYICRLEGYAEGSERRINDAKRALGGDTP